MKTSDLPADLQASAVSDVGRVRATNEDSFICDPERGVFAVIDGMGGHAGGEVAAAIARRELELRLRRETGTVEDRIREAIAAANASILAEATRVPALTQMACVLTVAVITPSHVVVGHVGDTRMYRIGPTGMRKLTHDHSPVGLLEDSGELSENDAMQHPDRNQVFREVGTSPRQPTDPDFIEVITAPLAANEAVLLCSDGLTDLVAAATIERLVREHAADPFRAATELVKAANSAGGKDNVTAIVATRPLFAEAVGAAPAASASDSRRGREDRPDRNPDATAVPAAVSSTLSGALVSPRSWPWALAAFAAVGAFLFIAWWTTGRPTSLPTLAGFTTTPRVLRVSAEGNAEYRSIAAALAAAEPGDTIDVGPGTYAETITMREGVSLRSRPRRAAILQRPATFSGAWAAIRATNIRSGAISGFVVAATSDAPVDYGVLASNANVELDDLDVSGAHVAGVRIDGTSTLLLRSSHLAGRGAPALVIDGKATPEILYNVITSDAAGSAAIHVEGGARAVIAGNIIEATRGGAVIGLSGGELADFHRENAIHTPASRPNGTTGARE